MRFIKTKYGIYTLIAKEPIYELNGKKYYCVEEQISSFSEDNVIKQSNTIEELCDGLYFVEDETNIPLPVNRLDENFDKDKKLTECCLEIGGWVTYLKNYSKKGCIKGAIFTSKGIIYVAKMNEKGELELL